MKGMLRKGFCRSAIAILLTFAMIFGTINVSRMAEAASKPAFQKKKLTLAKGKTAKLTVKKMPKGAKVLKTKWKVQKKSVLKVTLSGSKAKKKKAKTAKVKALKAGKSAVYCTITYRVKKGGKWKKKTTKVKATITVPSKAKVTPMPQKPTKPLETGKPGANTSAAPGNTGNPGDVENPGGTANPGGTENPGGTANPGGTTEPGGSTETSAPTKRPRPTMVPEVTPNPNAETLTWTGSLIKTQWTPDGNVEGTFRTDNCSSGLTVANDGGGWNFSIACADWSQYNFPQLKCYRADGDATTGTLQVWYGDDKDAENTETYPFGEWNAKGISLDKERVANKVIIANESPIGKIEICEGEAPVKSETDIGSNDFSKTALEFSKELKIGWNLGNTLDSIMNNGQFVDGNAGLAAETAWGCPKATEGLIKAVKEAGFNTVRLPVTWTNHTDPNNDYKIDEVWMDRVEEVVQYCTGNGMHVILNVHHDGNDNPDGSNSWLTPEPTDETAKAEMKARYQKIWSQIATRFKDYSNLVLFSSMNEFHHGHDAPTKDYCKLQNELHQIFVDTVRATGGNNAYRYLVLPGYNTNIDHAISGLVMPNDIVDDQLMVEVHYYDPYTFAADGNETDQWGSDFGGATAVDKWGQEKYLIDQLKKMKTSFVDKGIPVLIGEFGAPAKKDPANEKYRTYYLQYVVKYAVEYGLVPVFWDNGTSYKLFDRNTYEVANTDIVNGMMAALEPGYTIPLPK